MLAALTSGGLLTLWESVSFHIILSLALHILGISTGLWIWYIFPQDPSKVINRLPVRRREMHCATKNTLDARQTALLLKNRDSDSAEDDDNDNIANDATTRDDARSNGASPSLVAGAKNINRKFHTHRGPG